MGMDERSLGFYALGFAVGSAQGTPAVAVITSSGTAVSNLLPAVRAQLNHNRNCLPMGAPYSKLSSTCNL